MEVTIEKSNNKILKIKNLPNNEFENYRNTIMGSNKWLVFTKGNETIIIPTISVISITLK
jgi:hypothetical protein